MLMLGMNFNEKVLLIDSVTNQHGYIMVVPRPGSTGYRLGFVLPKTVGIVREESLEANDLEVISGIIEHPKRTLQQYIGQIASGCVSGTSDVSRRGMVIAVLGSLVEGSEAPQNFLIRTPDLEHFCINILPISFIPSSQWTGEERNIVSEFANMNSVDIVDNFFG